MSVKTIAVEFDVREVAVNPRSKNSIEESDEGLTAGWNTWCILLWRASCTDRHLVIVESTIGVRRIGLEIGIANAYNDRIWLIKVNRPTLAEGFCGGLS